ncbi:MAG: NADH-quinone oxidoreductase subunit NuoK [Bdellovibrionota bacterium]
MNVIPLSYYLYLSGVLASLGIFSIISRNNVFSILIGVELILNSAIINFMAFWRFNPSFETTVDKVSGPLIGIIIMVVATCELAVSLSILISAYKKYNSVRTDFTNEMRN